MEFWSVITRVPEARQHIKFWSKASCHYEADFRQGAV